MNLIVLHIVQAIKRDLDIGDIILRLLDELDLALHGDGVAVAEPVSGNCLAARIAAHSAEQMTTAKIV